jgi:hypothetical protein
MEPYGYLGMPTDSYPVVMLPEYLEAANDEPDRE